MSSLRSIVLLMGLLCGFALSQDITTPTVFFSAPEYNYDENGNPTSVSVTLVRDISAGDSTVNVSFPGTGTAIEDTDYSATTIPITFSGDEVTKTVDIPITQDNVVELDETFELTLSTVTNATIGAQGTATVTILNDDSATISINDVTRAEGTGSGYINFIFTVSLSQPVDIPIQFTPKTTFTDITEFFVSFWSRNAFGPDSPLTHTISVTTEKDSTVELDEQFLVTLGFLETFGRSITFADNVGAGTMLNDDQAVITLSGGDVVEEDSGTPKMRFTATIDKEVDVPVTAMISAYSNGATDGVDFRSKSERVTLTTTGTPFEVEIIPDNLAENKEYITTTLQKRLVEASGRNVILSNNVNGFIRLYGIIDDDFAPAAADDSPYQTVEDRVLNVNAILGLLANDTDQDDGDGPAHLKAVLKSSPTHGKLALQPDGAFTYTPDPDFFGPDSFTYAASDGTNESHPKNVNINVTEQIDIAVGTDLLHSPLVAGGDALDVFRVTVTNHGPSDATEVRLHQIDRFPAGVIVVSADASAGTYNRGSWALDLPENATATLILTIQTGPDSPAGVLPFGFSFGAARQAESNPVNNSASTSASIISAANTNTAIRVAPSVDLQSGLFVSKVTVTNHNSEPVPAFRLYVKNLPADVRVYNAHGTRAFGPHLAVLPYLLYNRPLPTAASVTLNIEFFRPSLDPNFTPLYEIELLPVPETMPASATSGIPVTRNQMLSNGDYLIEIASTPGAVYAVEYSHDMTTWTRVVPSITAPANRLQWIDNGPPKTSSHPSAVPARYYRFVLISPPAEQPSAP